MIQSKAYQQPQDYKKAFRTPIYALQYSTINQNTLKLRLKQTPPSTSSIGTSLSKLYQSPPICLAQHSKLAQLCQTIIDLINYICDPENISVEEKSEQVSLSIMQVNPLSRSKRVAIVSVKLMYQSTVSIEPIWGIIERCNKKEDLRMDQLKGMMEVLAMYVQEIRGQSRDHWESQLEQQSYNGNRSKSNGMQCHGQKIGSTPMGMNSRRGNGEYVTRKEFKNFVQVVEKQYSKIDYNEMIQQQISRLREKIQINFSQKLTKLEDLYLQLKQSLPQQSYYTKLIKQSYKKSESQPQSQSQSIFQFKPLPIPKTMPLVQVTDIESQINQQTKKIKKQIIEQAYRKIQKSIEELIKGSRCWGNLQRKVAQIDRKLKSGFGAKEGDRERDLERDGVLRSGDWVDPSCCHYPRLQLKGKTITVVKDDAHIFSRIKLPQSQKYQTFSFSVQIFKMQKVMGIGLIDQSYRSRSTMGKPPNALVYYTDGYYNGIERKIRRQQWLKEGDTVTVRANLSTGKVQWIIDGAVRLEFGSERVKNGGAGIGWVGYLYMTEGDCVELTDVNGVDV